MAKYFLRIDSNTFADSTLLEIIRQTASVHTPDAHVEGDVVLLELTKPQATDLTKRGLHLYPDIELHALMPPVKSVSLGTGSLFRRKRSKKGLWKVLDQIKAPGAWKIATGSSVTIAVIDTGICGDLPEFPHWKRSPIDPPSCYSGQHWNISDPHGSMCGAIAAATDKAGGHFKGVAPDATVLSARTNRLLSDLYVIYDHLIAAKSSGQIPGPLVVSNSYYHPGCKAPEKLTQDHPFVTKILAAIDTGIVVVFAAGNNHFNPDANCTNKPKDCKPSTIWAVNSLDSVLTVGNVNKKNTNTKAPHRSSSRGPGQWHRVLPKPDCVAPTYGQVVWGCGYMEASSWETSGACPQAAGLAALVLSVEPRFSPAEVGDIIRTTCHCLKAPHPCVGAGLIDCEAAVNEAVRRKQAH